MTNRITTFLLILTLFSCSEQKTFKPEELATQACDCFNKQMSGTIDSRLDSCLAKPISTNFDAIHKSYYTDETPDIAVKKFTLDVTLEMVRSCDQFYKEVDSMYTDFFTKISSDSIKGELISIQDSLENAPDSMKVRLLNKRINLLTKAREFEKASKDIAVLENDFQRPHDIHFVKAYIFRSQGKYNEAIEEIKKAVQANNNDELLLFQELLVRRQNGM